MKDRKTPLTDRATPETGHRKAQMAQLLAAVSVLSVSLGMAPVYAEDCATGQSCGQTSNGSGNSGEYLRKKLPGKMKSGTITLTRGAAGTPSSQTDLNSWQTPGTSNQIKLDSTANTNKGGNGMIGNHKDVMDTAQSPATTTTPHGQTMSGNHKDVMGVVQQSTTTTNQK